MLARDELSDASVTSPLPDESAAVSSTQAALPEQDRADGPASNEPERPRRVSLGWVGLPLLLVIYLAVALGTLSAWHHDKLDLASGDEPHYLVMADGIIHDHTLEQSQAYAREFRTCAIFVSCLSPEHADEMKYSHALPGPHGYYNIHNVGLPVIISVPYAIAGISGVRVALVVMHAGIVVLGWLLSGWFFSRRRARFLAVLPLAVAMPVIAASNQIYPDLPAGMLCLFGLYALGQSKQWTRIAPAIAASAVLALLPWLQLRFAPPAFILLAALLIALRRRPSYGRWAVALGAPMLVSFVLLATYNLWAFGNVTGPYSSDAVEYNKTTLMVLLGLGVDQDQGIFVQQPLHLLALLYLGSFAVRYRLMAATIGLVVLSMLVPDAAHPNLYGGLSMVGRFGWAASLCLFVPTLFALSRVLRASRWAFAGVVAAALLIQVKYLSIVIEGNVSLINRAGVWFYSYPILWLRWYRSFPALYDVSWSYSYLPNLIAVLTLVTLVAIGVVPALRRRAGWYGLGVLVVATVTALVVGRVAAPPREQRSWAGSEVPGLVGHVVGDSRTASEPDVAGVLAYVPLTLPQGTLEVDVAYSSSASPGTAVGTLEVVLGDKVVYSTPLDGTRSAQAVGRLRFPISSDGQLAQLRTSYLGHDRLTVTQMQITT